MSETLIIIFQLLAGFALLFFGGDWLVNGGVALASRFRISPLVVGMTIVAFGTSAPELLVSLTSSIKGIPGIAIGNVVGSNIANICLILGLTSIICPIVTENRKVLVNGTVMILASLILVLFSLHNGISRLEGTVLFLCLILFTAVSVRKGRMNKQEAQEFDEEGKSMTVLVALGLIILACTMLAYGADLLVNGASALARSIGVSEKVIGLTIVALGTSLPELAASVAAAFKKQMDISIGNIIGSNIFNILCVLGVSTSVKPISFDFSQYSNDFWFMIAVSVALLMLTSFRKKKGRLGHTAGIILLLAYSLYAFFLFK